jgi:hypothetical protein
MLPVANPSPLRRYFRRMKPLMDARPRARQLVRTLLVAGAGLLAAPFPGAAAVDFGRDVQPILSDKCYHCHGPDETARKAKLRFDTKDGAFRLNKEGKAVIVPGKGAESELVKRLLSKDPDAQMPPPESHRTVTPQQAETLRKWIDEGAKWGLHWAFQPIGHPAVPVLRDRQARDWARTPVDRFILARLEREGLKPAPEADRERLIRRVTLDLTGLPPTPAEVDAFVRDASPTAYERLVDRLLDSPRYGERMAAEWLDLARYSDTHGYQADRYRPMWPWRDWVIGAFNRNLPFDQFVTWQLAGDLLPNPTKEQRLATAFNRHHLQNEEGGIVEEEFRVSYVVDRVNTFGTAFLGLTMECSRCHDHKYDPLTQRDYYSLFSLFQNIDESGQTVYFGDVMPEPAVLLSTDEQDAKLAQLRTDIGAQQARLAAVRESARPGFAEWLKHRPAEPQLPGLVGAYSFDELKDGKFANAAGTNSANAEEVTLAPGHAGQAVQLNGENGVSFPGVGGFTRADPFSFSLWLNPSVHAPRFVVLHKSKAWMDAGSRGYELLLEDGHAAVGLHHMWPGNSLKVRTRAVLPTNAWSGITVTYDGSSRAAGVHVYVNGEPAPVEVIRDGLWKDFTYGGDEPNLTLGHRMRDSGFKGGLVDDVRVFDRELSALEAAQLGGRDELHAALTTAPEALSAGQLDALFDYYLAAFAPETRAWREALANVRREQNRLVTSIQDIMAMQELPQPKPAFILKRGAYDAPGEPVSGDTPHFLPPFPAGAPRNRLGLAQWLLAPENPLMARVTVNRAWQLMFGRGLVETSDNLGSQGSPPTHPELLDWLARDFAGHGWDWKALLRELALSATYRQSSKVTPDLLARDPQNLLLARGPAKRLTAEMIRDQALAAGGLLAEKLGGPSVKPYQPGGLWESAWGGSYENGHGADLHRRSLYTFWKRTVPPPAMIAFDAAERNVCVVRRQSTSTPLQALALLNDPQIVEAARHVGERMLREGGPTADARVTFAFRLVTGRTPTAREIAILRQLLDEQQARFTADPAGAAKLLAVGEAKNSGDLPATDLAAGTVLAQALFSHDEAVMRR